MTDAERDFAIQHLTAGRDTFLAAIEGLTENQLRFQPQPERWTIAECAEHVAITEDAMWNLVCRGAVSAAGIALDPAKYPRFVSAVIERARKVPAPENMRPTGRFASVGDARTHFLKGRERALTYARECPDDLRGLFAPHPLLGEIDCYRFLLLLALHPARHAVQIEEIKRDPGYPRS